MSEKTIDADKGITEIVLSEAKGEHIQDLGSEAVELGLDSLLDEGLLKDIPVAGTLVNLFKLGKGIKEALFAKKLLRFLYALKDIPLEQRVHMIDRINTSEDYRGKVGEKLVFILDRLDDLDKPGVVGSLFAAAIEEKISFEQFLRLSMIVDRGFFPDLKQLAINPVLLDLSKETKEHFANIGIMTVVLQSVARSSRDWGNKGEPPPQLRYTMNELGEDLAKFGFHAPGMD